CDGRWPLAGAGASPLRRNRGVRGLQARPAEDAEEGARWMNVYEFHQGSLPLLISIPHAGTYVPEPIAQRFTLAGSRRADTDWHVDKLYEFARELGASVLKANYSRYVVDLNRSPDSTSLYEGSPTSPVCPAVTFDDEPIYQPGREVTATEIEARLGQYWRPYHQRL